MIVTIRCHDCKQVIYEEDWQRPFRLTITPKFPIALRGHTDHFTELVIEDKEVQNEPL